MQTLSVAEEHENWIPLLEYALKKGISLSTLRRHIKANKVTYRIENGRYLLFNHQDLKKHSLHQDIFSHSLPSDLETTKMLKDSLQKLELDFQKAQEEIAELQTLIALYEEKIPQNKFNN